MRISKKIIILAVIFMSVKQTFVCAEYPFTADDRDPFLPLISKTGRILIFRETDVSSFVLKGIIYSQDSALAVINDEILKEDDMMGDYVVYKIEKRSAILKKGDEEIILKLEEE